LQYGDCKAFVEELAADEDGKFAEDYFAAVGAAVAEPSHGFVGH
jgi:hypothetical protein